MVVAGMKDALVQTDPEGSIMTGYYETNLQHIQDALKRIDLLIQLRILEIRAEHADVNEFSGLYISEEEIDALLSTTYPARNDDPRTQAIRRRIAELETEIKEKREESVRRGTSLKIPRLAMIFGLTPFEEDVLVVGMAPELDTKYERLYAYLHNDATRKRPTVDLVLQVLCSSDEEKLHARQYFNPAAPLLKHHLIQLREEPEAAQKTLVSKFIEVDDRIINYLLDVNHLDPTIAPFTELILPQTGLGEILLPEAVKKRIQKLSSWYPERRV
ncbi:MAG: hypothetical protein EFT35_00430, partial [Methanophagales archaeon ANME-1-THS]